MNELVTGHAGVNEHHARDAIRVREGEVEDGAAAERTADEPGALDVERVHDRGEIAVERVLAVGSLRATEPSRVIADGAVMSRELLELRIPHLDPRLARVQKDYVTTASRELVVKVSAISWRVPTLDVHRLKATAVGRARFERASEGLEILRSIH